MFVLHRCDETSCVRADHLFLGTQLDNMRDAREKGRTRYRPFKRGNRSWKCRTERHGDDNPRSKVATVDVARIRAAKRKGEALTRFAGELGVSYGTVYRIARGEKRRRG
jgi:hypothetical protein